MSNPTSSSAAVVADTIVRTVELGVTITDAAVDGDVTVVFCTLLDDGERSCPGCGGVGVYRDTVIRTVTDVPVVGHPLRLRVRVPRYRCVNSACEREVFAHNTDRLARRGCSTTRRCARYIVGRLMIDRATVAAVARELGLSWDTVNTIAIDATQVIVAADTDRLDGVRVIGVDEHRWSHNRRSDGDGFVTVIIDLTPVLDGTGRARLLDLVPGRSSAALKTWLSAQSTAFRDRVEVVAMDGFGSYKTGFGRDEVGPVPSANPAADLRAPRPLRGSALPGTTHSAHPATAAQRSPKSPLRSSFRRRSPPRRRTVLELLPTHDRRLRSPRPTPRQGHDDHDHRRTAQRCPQRTGRTGPTRPHTAPAPG